METGATDEESLRKEALLELHLKWDKESNQRFNTSTQMCFTEQEIHLPSEENPLHRVNEITLEEKGDFSIEIYDAYTTISSTIPCSLKRVVWNRLNVNFIPSVNVDLVNNDEKMRIHDWDFALNSEKRSRKSLHSGLSKDEIAMEKFKFYQEYIGWRYGLGKEEIRLTEWKVYGIQIEFINKKNEGSVIIVNKSSRPKTIRSQGNRVTIAPGIAHNFIETCFFPFKQNL